MTNRNFSVKISASVGLVEAEQMILSLLSSQDPSVSIEWMETLHPDGKYRPCELPPVGCRLVEGTSRHEDYEYPYEENRLLFFAIPEGVAFGGSYFSHNDFSCDWMERSVRFPAGSFKWCGRERGWVSLEDYRRMPAREIEPGFHWVPKGYNLLKVNSSYYGSHQELGEGDCPVYFAVLKGAKVPEINLSHGHFSSNTEDLAELPAGTLEWDEGWKPFSRPEPDSYSEQELDDWAASFPDRPNPDPSQ